MKFLQKKQYAGKNPQVEAGQSLIEILIVIAVLVIVATFATQLIFVVLQGNKIIGDRDVALRIAEESMDAVFAISIERWDDIFELTKGTTQYHTQQSMGQFALASGTAATTLNGIVYTRYVTFQNVCRSTAVSRDITGITTMGGSTTTCSGMDQHDPTVQQATVTVSWGFNGNITLQEYVFRWRNEVCPQTEWNAIGTGPTTNCSTIEYEMATDLQTGTELEVQ